MSVLRVPAFVRTWVGAGRGEDEWAGRVRSELADELPDEDIGEDLDDCLDLYEMGSKPRCEEAEYLHMVQDARDRIAWGH
ncbi:MULTISPECIES: hypothetical protein [unclassified Streptomyces]|uniref:hypothetical protein n=1 Tax=unclassified Streptomyces TaxID=2593676 RepID=UPI000DB8FE7E|nr:MULTISPECIES: hypothetical protein [unclassified Streptomyces]MYT68537.1 hypothetical protein [Streptomyces sp. SID8367]RAJ86209.1 hypothetical protein K377_03055 [Streptomyces sp. PsTaAH-137]